jgi:DNA-binding NarL/FixJ family response regulator
VLGLIAQGLTNKEIAGTLFISEATAKVHVRHIFDKLGVRTSTEAALRASEIDGEA